MDVPLQGIKAKIIAYKKTSGRTHEIPFFPQFPIKKGRCLFFFPQKGEKLRGQNGKLLSESESTRDRKFENAIVQKGYSQAKHCLENQKYSIKHSIHKERTDIFLIKGIQAITNENMGY